MWATTTLLRSHFKGQIWRRCSAESLLWPSSWRDVSLCSIGGHAPKFRSNLGHIGEEHSMLVGVQILHRKHLGNNIFLAKGVTVTDILCWSKANGVTQEWPWSRCWLTKGKFLVNSKWLWTSLQSTAIHSLLRLPGQVHPFMSKLSLRTPVCCQWVFNLRRYLKIRIKIQNGKGTPKRRISPSIS